MNTSDYLRNKILVDHYVTAPGYVEVSSSRIDNDGTGGTFPTTVSRTEIPEQVVANVMSNLTEVDFGQVGAADDGFLAKWFRTMDAASGGNQLHRGLLGTNRFNFVASAEDNKIKINGGGKPFVVDDRLMLDSDGSLPGGLTAGTPYFVLAVDANDNLTLSLTSGGAEVDITSDGEGYGVEGVGISLVQNQSLKIPASALTATQR